MGGFEWKPNEANKSHRTSLASYHVAAGRVRVLGGAEASESLLEHEYPEGVAGGHQDVDAQVKLVAVDDERLDGRREQQA